MKLDSVELNALIEHNNALIANLDKLRIENEQAEQLYQNLQKWSHRPTSVLVPSSQIELPETVNIDGPVEQARLKAATVIQRAYRKHLYRVKSRLRAQSWATVSAKDSIQYIDVISKRISQAFARPKFDMTQWKDELERFGNDRIKRATLFEKRNRLIDSLRQERRFIETKDSFADDIGQLTRLKPYMFEKAATELKWQLECAETEALINGFIWLAYQSIQTVVEIFLV
uniref:Uncharacterized protein n=1 Tax=Panagrellus redivivus TaxID=6233 RepID=A0A7E4W0E0_PANRE